MSDRWKIAAVVLTVAVIVSTPLVWLLDGPDTGELVGASIQAATGIAGLVWTMCHQAAQAAGPADMATETGTAESSLGGHAQTGVRRPGGAGNGSAHAAQTGNATAQGAGSSASTGIDYS